MEAQDEGADLERVAVEDMERAGCGRSGAMGRTAARLRDRRRLRPIVRKCVKLNTRWR